MKLMTNPNLMVQLTNRGTLYMLVSGKNGIEYEDNIEFYLEVLNSIQLGKSINDIVTIVANHGWYISKENIEKLISEWLDRNILKKYVISIF